MKKIYALATSTLILSLAACATSSDPSVTKTAMNTSPTAVDVMKNGGTYEYVKPDGPIYANSSAELAKRYVGRHVDELPEATSSSKAVQDGNEVVCKVVKQTRTRLREKKICAPRKEWDSYKSAAKDVMRQKQITRRETD